MFPDSYWEYGHAHRSDRRYPEPTEDVLYRLQAVNQ
jgi:hypothetical protein